MKTLLFIWALVALETSAAALWIAGGFLKLANASLNRGDKLYWKPRRYPKRYLKLGVGFGRLADTFTTWSRGMTARSTAALQASRE